MARGSIQKRGKNSWRISVSLGRGPDGRYQQYRETVLGTKAEAEKRLAQVQVDFQSDRLVMPDKITVETLFERWLEDFVRPNRQPNTYKFYSNITEYYIIPHLGRHRVQKLQSITIQQLLAQLLEKGGEDKQGLSPSTVAHVHSTLSACFSYGVKHGMLKTNPCQAVTPPRVPKKAPKVWDTEQTKRVLAAAYDIHYGIYAQLVLYTGLRVNEALALRWSNVDLDKNIITVTESIKEVKKDELAIVGAPKTDSGLRSIPFSPALKKILRTHRLKQKKKRLAYGALYTNRDLVISTNKGGYVRADCLRDLLMAKLVKLANVPHIPVRNLRHTHATLLLAAGVHPKIVQERLGHSNVAITMDIYSSALPNIQAAAVTEMDALLSETNL